MVGLFIHAFYASGQDRSECLISQESPPSAVSRSPTAAPPATESIQEPPWERSLRGRLSYTVHSDVRSSPFGQELERLVVQYNQSPDILLDLHRMAWVLTQQSKSTSNADRDALEQLAWVSISDWMQEVWLRWLTLQYDGVNGALVMDVLELAQRAPPPRPDPVPPLNPSEIGEDSASVFDPSHYPAFSLDTQWEQPLLDARRAAYLRCVGELVELPEALTPSARGLERALYGLQIPTAERPWAFRIALLHREILGRLEQHVEDLAEPARAVEAVLEGVFEDVSDPALDPREALIVQRRFHTERLQCARQMIRSWWDCAWNVNDARFFEDLFQVTDAEEPP